MPRGRPRTKNLTRGRPTSKTTIERKPIRPLERQRMRPWLIELLDNQSCSQLGWSCKEKNMFRVSWKHAAGQTFDPSADATLFELWARHTGKFYTGDKPDPKKWKANFRCALNSLQDVEEEKSQGVRKGNNAFKVYRFLDEKRPKIKTTTKKSKDSDDEEVGDELTALRNTGTKSRPRFGSKLKFYDSEGVDSPTSDSSHSDWEDGTSQELGFGGQAMECDSIMDSSKKSPLPHFDKLWQQGNLLGCYDRSCQKERLSESQYPDRQPESFSPQRSPDFTNSPLCISENEEEASIASSCPTEDEIADTLNVCLMQDPSFLSGFLDEGCYVEEAPEQVIGTDSELMYPNTEPGPNVIVLAQEGQYDYYDFTSMADL